MKTELISQYRATLKMLAATIAHCPNAGWAQAGAVHPYWQIVYHTLHYTALYSSDDETTFTPWQYHRPGYHILGKAIDMDESQITANGYASGDMQTYLMQIYQTLATNIMRQDISAPSGFDWIAMNKLELHFYNLRHLQHHTGQLIERLHQQGIYGINWVDSVH